MARPSVVKSPSEWQFQQSYIERLMDHAALTSAHPDNTLLLAGPARYQLPGQGGGGTPFDDMLPIGMVQNINITQTKPTQPLMAVGSGRMFFSSGKAQGTAAVARLFVNGRNLLRALYTNVVQAGVDVNKFDDRAAVPQQGNQQSQFFANLDSELFLIPVGFGVLFRDKTHHTVGAFYLELCMINNWTINFSAGQNLIMENTNIMFDRLLPIGLGDVGATPNNYPLGADAFNSMFYGDDGSLNQGLTDK